MTEERGSNWAGQLFTTPSYLGIGSTVVHFKYMIGNFVQGEKTVSEALYSLTLNNIKIVKIEALFILFDLI